MNIYLDCGSEEHIEGNGGTEEGKLIKLFLHTKICLK